MAYQPKNYDHLLGTPGFSDELLKNHFTLYQGYVSNANKLAETAEALVSQGKAGTPEYAEMKRRFGWEFNGMRLHEYYFGNMARNGKALQRNSDLMKKIEEDFGSYNDWHKDFQATGNMRGIGWAVLYYDPQAQCLLNAWINEHDTGHFAGCPPILIMDVFEHAYMIDYGVKKEGYMEAFFKAADWTVASGRFANAPRELAVV